MERVRAGDRDPGDEGLALSRGVFALSRRIRLDGSDGLGETLHVRNRGVDGESLKAREGVLFDGGQRFFQVPVAVRVKVGVAGVVVLGVKLSQLGPCEIRNVLGVSSRYVRVSQAGEQRPPEIALHGCLRRRQRALHLVEDHALVAKTALGVARILELEADALLFEGVLGE